MSKNIWKVAGGVTLITFVSRLSGYIRDKVMAYILGASFLSDSFFVAFRIPNMFRGLLAEGALHAAFIPIFSEVKREKEKEILRFASQVFYLLTFISAGIVVLGIIFSPFIINLMAKEFNLIEGKFSLTVLLNRIMFPYLFFISLAGLMQGILNVLSKFYLPASTPIFLNISIIILGISLSKFGLNPVYSFSFGVLFGGFLQFYLQYREVKKIGINFYFPKNLISPEVKELFYKILPGIFALGINEINQIIGTRFAAFSGDKSVSYLYYSFRLIHLVYGGVIVSLFTLLLPSLSNDVKDSEKFSSKLNEGIHLTSFLTIPSILGLFFLSKPIILVLFQGGRFKPEDTTEVAFCLMSYSFSLLPYAYSKILTSAYFAKKNTKTPAFSSLVALITFVIFCFILTSKYKHIGIALSNSISSFFQLFYLLVFSKKYIPEYNIKDLFYDFLKILTFNFPIFFILFYLSKTVFINLNQSFYLIGIKLFFTIIFIILIYFFLGIFFKIKGSFLLKNLLKGER
jgi:putative peptidoglycan lipid II flippase